MYKLIITDDEETIRNGLSKYINWEELGYELVACFDDGSLILEYIKEHTADVILTDIKMLEVSGLEVAKYVYNNQPNIKVVIISGHKEFEYAKKAIEYNVQYFLTKPTDFEEINSVFSKLKVALDKVRENEKQIKADRERFEEILPLLKEQFLNELIMGILKDRDEIEKRIKLGEFKSGIIEDRCVVIDFQIKDYDKFIENDWEYGKDGLYSAVRNYLTLEQEGINFFPLFKGENRIKILAFLKIKIEEDKIERLLGSMLEDLLTSMNEFFKFNSIFEIEGIYESIFDYAEKIKTNADSNNYKADYYNYRDEKLKILISSIKLGDYQETAKIMDSFLDELKKERFSIQKEEVTKLFTDIFKNVEMEESFSNLVDGNLSVRNAIFKAISVTNNIEELRGETKDQIFKIKRNVEASSNKSHDIIIKQAKEYIIKNFHRDISLNDVAEHVFISPVYFSRLFKQSVGEYFSDYLIRLRMNKAIELLKERKYKIYEISQMVGYQSNKYFARLFKQYTGYTQKEYCRNVLNDSEQKLDG